MRLTCHTRPLTPLLGVLLMVCAMCLTLPAQEPAHFRFGADQFNGIQIYDVIQDQRQHYWFATSEGLYRYDFHAFSRVEPDKARSVSMFNFVMDRQGVVYCHNLNNQIFRITQDSCRLFFELKTEDGSSDMSLAVANDGNLIVGARQVLALSPEGKVVARTQIAPRYIGPSYILRDSTVLLHLGSTDTLITYRDGTLAMRLLAKPQSLKQLQVLRFFSHKGTSLAHDLNSGQEFLFLEDELGIVPFMEPLNWNLLASPRLYETSGNLWSASSQPGVRRLGEGNAFQEQLFPDYYISNVYEDQEGNVLLSTFDKGVLVVPDLSIQGPDKAFAADPITALCHLPGEGMVLGSSRGKLSLLKGGRLEQLSTAGTHAIRGLHLSPDGGSLIFADGTIKLLDTRSGQIHQIGELSLKDAAWVDDRTFFLGTHVGILLCTWDGPGTFTALHLQEHRHRVHSMEWSPTEQRLYAATGIGLLCVDLRMNATRITWQGEDIFAGYLHAHAGTVYASTREWGLMLIRDAKVMHTVRTAPGQRHTVVRKLSFHPGGIIASTTDGLLQLDTNGSLVQALQLSFGFPHARVQDFDWMDGKLWVSHTDGLQVLDLERHRRPPPLPVVRIDLLQVNDDTFDLQTPARLASTQRKVEYLFSSPTLRGPSALRFHHRLVGQEEQWQVLGTGVDRVTYNALPPGTYQFEVRAEFQGRLGPAVSHSFTIGKPIYAQVWFILTCVATFLLAVYLIYRYQLGVQRRKSAALNELNASRLIAIQSQMNPHFIFNSLNSIQDLILKGDVEHSYSYITTFSNLVRKTLQYSDKDFIEFGQEVELLRLYLSLEMLRFKKDLKVDIDYPEDLEDILIPPMLIQPFVENALVHGLLHKAGEKRLSLRFELREVLVCTLEDNGVGREQATAIRERQRGDHESFAGKAIRKRLEILDGLYEGGFGYAYEDLREDGKPAGTRVILRIPVRRQF